MLQNETKSVTFSCQAIGEPFPVISWCFNSAIIDVSDDSKYNIATSNGESSLTISNVQSSDAGTYICNTTNVIGMDTSSGILTVNGKNNV